MNTMFTEPKTKKRSFIDGEIIKIHEDKKSKQENVQKNMYGDGVSWFRGEIIGKGSFGCVFLANSKKPKSKHSSYYPRIMAVKSAEVSGSGSIQKEKEVMDNIRGSCPNVIKCFGEEITNGDNGQMVYNLLLEYGSGGTLADLIKKSGGNGLPELDVIRYTRSIVRGLSHIHKRGYVHCDLKPDNILLVSGSKDGFFDAKIGDFGLAKRANQNHKNKNKKGVYNWRGTPMYLSPEAVMYGVQEPPADIWAVGCIVSEMLTGKPLWLTGNPLWFSKQDSCVDEVLSRMKISKEGGSFLKGCLCRKIMCRLSADMLLDHPFLKGLIEDDDANEVKESHQEVFDINTITSSLMFSDDDEMWLTSYSDGSCYSDVDAMEDEESKDARFLELQQYPVTLTISKGV